jgi:hypothetical protein
LRHFQGGVKVVLVAYSYWLSLLAEETLHWIEMLRNRYTGDFNCFALVRLQC